jgi:hypothetical protein
MKYVSMLILTVAGFSAHAGYAYKTFHYELTAGEVEEMGKMTDVEKQNSGNEFCAAKTLLRATRVDVNGHTLTIICLGNDRQVHALHIREALSNRPSTVTEVTNKHMEELYAEDDAKYGEGLHDGEWDATRPETQDAQSNAQSNAGAQ